MLSEPLVKLNSVYVKVQEALLHLRGDLLVGDTGVVGRAVGGTARIFDAPAFYAQQVRQILRKFGADAHLFMPGPGVPILGPEIMDYSKLAYGQGVTVDASSKTVTFDGSQPDWGGPTWINGGVSGTSGKMYQLSYTVVRTTGSVKVSVGPEGYESTPGLITKQQVGGGGNIQLQSYAAPTKFVGSIVGLSIREILGYTNYLNGFQAGNYLESTGNTNAALDGAVGLVLDAAGSVGAELVAGQVWTTGSANTSISGGNTVVFNGAASGAIGTASIPVALNKTYQITLTVSGLTVGQIGVDAGGASTYPNIGANGTYTIRTVCAGGAGAVYVVSKAAGTVASVQVTSIREVTGTHAAQATTANKPTLRRGVVNLRTYGNDFSNAVWGKNASPTLTYSYGNGPYGPSTRLQGTGFSSGVAGFPNIASGTTLTAAFVVRNISGSGVFRFGCDSNPVNGVADFTPSTGAMVNGGGVSQSSKYDLGGGWWLVACTYTTTAATNSMVAFQGNATALDVEFQTAGLFQGTLTAAQIIAAGGIPLTTTTPASSSAGAYAWQFDGSNDVLNISSALVSQTDDFFDCVGGVVFNKSAYPFVSYPAKSAAGNGVIGGMFVDAGGFLAALWKTDAGASTFVPNSSVPVADGQTCVFSVEKSGGFARCSTNGMEGPQVAVPVSGITVDSAAIGTNNNGLIFARVLIIGTVSPADKKTLTKWLGSIAGVAIA